MEEIKAQLGETPVDKEIHVNATVFDWSVTRQCACSHTKLYFFMAQVLFICLIQSAVFSGDVTYASCHQSWVMMLQAVAGKLYRRRCLRHKKSCHHDEATWR